jgi:hypothetical protein
LQTTRPLQQKIKIMQNIWRGKKKGGEKERKKEKNIRDGA